MLWKNDPMIQVHPLPIRFVSNDQEQIIYPSLIQTDASLTLVDCGYEGQLNLIEDAAAEIGLSLQQLTGIIITHHDIDHMGGLFHLKQKYPDVKVYASATEAPYVSGEKKSLRLIQAESLFDQLPEAYKPWAIEFQQQLANMNCVLVDEGFEEDAPLSFMKDVISIHTPGHMPGHISLYIPSIKTLIAADALVIENDALQIANPQFTLDMQQAIESVKKLSELDIDTLICYHGGIMSHNIQNRLNHLANR